MRISRPIALALSAAVHAMTVLAAEPADWKFVQDVPVAASGLIRLHLPLETIDAARLGLEDLRVFDRLGTEIPYLVESALPSDRRPHRARSFRPGLAGTATMLEIETGVPEPIEGVALETFATQFIKPVSVEGSEDRVNWKILAQGQPIFRQPNGPSQLQIAFAPQAWTWLRVTIDDRRSAPVPFTGATVLAVASEPSTETLTATIADRTELPGQTRLLLHLPAAGLRLAGLHLDTPDPLFTRHITISSRQVMENSIRETSVATGSIYRLATEGFSDSSNTFVRVETVMPTRELLLLIDNQDSPPLQIQAVRARRRPVSIVFFTPTNGVFKLYSGNRQRPAPQYDLARLSTSLKSAATTVVPASGLTNNPGYRPAEAMPTVSGIGPVLEVQEWNFRKRVQVSRPGWQQLELDLPLLSKAQPGFRDLRLIQSGRQLPYLMENTAIRRSVTPRVSPADDPSKAKHSRWQLQLPQTNLPLDRFTCASPTALFQRDLRLYESVADERGRSGQITLGQASWTRTPVSRAPELSLTLSRSPAGDTLYLETFNGDNPPIGLERFQFFYPVTRVYFKVTDTNDVLAYYGQAKAESPRYDLTLVADQLLKVEVNSASLGTEEPLQGTGWRGRWAGGGTMRLVFWGALILAVVGMLVVITRLLPAQPPR